MTAIKNILLQIIQTLDAITLNVGQTTIAVSSLMRYLVSSVMPTTSVLGHTSLNCKLLYYILNYILMISNLGLKGQG
jgi:hypothetical protein